MIYMECDSLLTLLQRELVPVFKKLRSNIYFNIHASKLAC